MLKCKHTHTHGQTSAAPFFKNRTQIVSQGWSFVLDFVWPPWLMSKYRVTGSTLNNHDIFHWSPLEGTVSNTTAGSGTTKYNRIQKKKSNIAGL